MKRYGFGGLLPSPGLPLKVLLYRIAGWFLAGVLLGLRATCRGRNHDDPRPALREQGRNYIYAIRHAHQLAAMLMSDDRIAAMVSASTDGDLLAPSLVARRLIPVRGSTRKDAQDKGGRSALAKLAQLMSQGTPVLLAVDGPRGPRGKVHRGAADLAHDTGMPVLPAMAIPSRRWILPGTWDRFQLPKPFSTIHIYYGEPIEPSPDDDRSQTLTGISRALDILEAIHDPEEWRGVTR